MCVFEVFVFVCVCVCECVRVFESSYILLLLSEIMELAKAMTFFFLSFFFAFLAVNKLTTTKTQIILLNN